MANKTNMVKNDEKSDHHGICDGENRRTGKLFDERCVDSAKTLLHKCPDICAIGFLVFRLYGVFQTDFFGPADDGPSASAPAAPAAAPPARSWRRRKTGYKNTAPKMITAPR